MNSVSSGCVEPFRIECGVQPAPPSQQPGRRRDCHSADTPSPSLLKRLLKGEGGAAGWQSRRRLQQPEGLAPFVVRMLTPLELLGGFKP